MKNELLHCLSLLSEETRRHISSYYQKENTEPQHMAKWIVDFISISKMRQRLTENEQYAIQWFLWKSHGGVLWDRENKDVHWGKMRPGLLQLAQKGWIYALRNERNERFFYCPREIRSAWVLSAHASVNHRWSSSLRGQMQPLQQPTIGIGQALFHLLVSIDANPWRRSKSGHFSKRQAEKIDIELDLPAEPLLYTKWGKDQEWPSWISLLIEIANRFQLLQITDQQLRISPTALASWLYQSWEEMMNKLYRTIRSLWSEHHPEMDGDWLLLETCVGKDWVCVDDIVQFKEKMMERKLRQEETQSFHHLITLLDVMGWLETGKWACGKKGIRWRNADGKPKVDFAMYIQNSMEIYIPHSFPLIDRYQLAQMADFMGGDQWLIYLLTPSSLQRAKQYGLTLQEVIQFLYDQSGGKLTDWVRKQITHDWNQEKRFMVEEMVLIHAPSSEEMEEVLAEMDGKRIRRFSDTCVGIPKHGSFMEKWLEKKKGVKCRLPVTESFFEVGQVKDHRDLLSRSKVVDQKPTVDQWFPFVHRLPVLWSNGMRSYRIDMLKEIIRQSIHYQLPLKIERNGKCFQIHPVTLQWKDGQIVVVGQGNQPPVPLHQIHRIQVQMPFFSKQR